VLATRDAFTAVDRVLANEEGRAMSLDNPIQRVWRDERAHAAAVPEGKLSAYGALAFSLRLATAH
jgi:hypothetical protein